MNVEDGDLWDFHKAGFRVVVTTNIGWHPVTKANNMGAGMALQASLRYPSLPRWYGCRCAKLGDALGVIEDRKRRLVFLPVKPLLTLADPERSWMQKAQMPFVTHGVASLCRVVRKGSPIAMSFPGCGNGGLDELDVASMMAVVLAPELRRGLIVVVRKQGGLSCVG